MAGQGRANCDQDSAAAEGGEKGGATVNRASERRREDDQQRGVKSALFRQLPFIPEADDHERKTEHDHSTERNLGER